MSMATLATNLKLQAYLGATVIDYKIQTFSVL